MSLTPEIMRGVLFVGSLGMAALAVLYLRQRNLSIVSFVGWGLIAILVPLVGPFFVIWMRPHDRVN